MKSMMKYSDAGPVALRTMGFDILLCCTLGFLCCSTQALQSTSPVLQLTSPVLQFD
jgi:hypothetical protein